MTGFETENKYVVKNSLGQQVYYTKEVSDCATRQCCRPNRLFQMQITDNASKEVMRHMYYLRGTQLPNFSGNS